MTRTSRLLRAGAATAAMAFAAAFASSAFAAAAPAPNPEPNNVLAQNHDALFNAAQAAHTGLLDKLTPVTEATLDHPADGDWLTWRRSYASTGFSPLKGINKANVRGLNTAWAWV